MIDKARASTASATRCDAIVVGAGFGGLCAVHKLRERGMQVQGFEAGGDVGGVWYWNRYPGARVDLPSIDYSYGFSEAVQQGWNWSEYFAAQPELMRYFDYVARTLDLRKHFRFNTRVLGAAWDEQRQLWSVRSETRQIGATGAQGGMVSLTEAPYLVMATGPLSIPKDPEFPGLERFRGELYRAAKWPHHPVSYAGKRVGVIGTGSSGIQIVQEVGPLCRELQVFQRTPSFTMPMRNRALEPGYLNEVKRNYTGLREAARNSPNGGLRPASTRAFYSVPPAVRQELLEDAWKMGGLAMLGTFSDLMVNPEANEEVASFVRGKITQVVKDPLTAEQLTPRGYPIFARRPCLDSSYYETFNLSHVKLVDCLAEPITAVTERGVRTAQREIELDMVILATGYDGLTGAMLACEVTGRAGATVKDKWAGGSSSLLGLMMAGFPNLFMTTGPNGPAALANIVRTSENDVDWIAGLMAHMEQHGLGAAEPTPVAEEAWMKTVAALAERTLLSKAQTWYVGANVSGKPKGLPMFTGGFPKYREACAAVAANGYRDLAFEAAPAAGAASAAIGAMGVAA
jgi:cation diffusion facilitator CzcD-associated flavoprotein CzcO